MEEASLFSYIDENWVDIFNSVVAGCRGLPEKYKKTRENPADPVRFTGHDYAELHRRMAC